MILRPTTSGSPHVMDDLVRSQNLPEPPNRHGEIKFIGTLEYRGPQTAAHSSCYYWQNRRSVLDADIIRIIGRWPERVVTKKHEVDTPSNVLW